MTTHPAPPRRAHTLLQAVRSPRFLLTAWPWRGLAYTGSSMLVAFVLLLAASPILGLWLALFLESPRIGSPSDFGGIMVLLVFCLAFTTVLGPWLALPLGALERWRLGLVQEAPARSGHRVPPAGLWAWVRTRYAEAATWRELAYAGLMFPLVAANAALTGILGFVGLMLIVAPFLLEAEPSSQMDLGTVEITSSAQAAPYTLLAPVLLLLALYTSSALSALHATVARALLVGPPKEELRAELSEVTESRVRLVNAFEYERSRIERDLHDGAQQRLVALSMDLGLARLDLEEDGEADRRVVAAQAKANDLIEELRQLVRGIHPRVLTDRGLPAALAELADHCPVPTRVDTEIPGRLPAHVEGTAYFVVAEALTNVYKHTEANAATVHARTGPGAPGEPDSLVVEVTDYGSGGADPAKGSGLTGLKDRVAVMGGTMELSSPEGGPTRIRVELPCGPIPPTPGAL